MKRFRTILAAFVLTVIAGTSSMLAQTPDTAPEATGPVKMFGVPVTLPYEEFKAAVEQSPEFQAFKNYVLTKISSADDFQVKNGFTSDYSKGILFSADLTGAFITLRDILTLKYGEPEERILATLSNNLTDKRGMVASSLGRTSVNTYGLYWKIPGGEIMLTNLRNDFIYLLYSDYEALREISKPFFNGL